MFWFKTKTLVCPQGCKNPKWFHMNFGSDSRCQSSCALCTSLAVWWCTRSVSKVFLHDLKLPNHLFSKSACSQPFVEGAARLSVQRPWLWPRCWTLRFTLAFTLCTRGDLESDLIGRLLRRTFISPAIFDGFNTDRGTMLKPWQPFGLTVHTV